MNRAEHRDKTFANVVQGAKTAIDSPALAPQLFLALHAAANNIHDGLLTPEDAKLLSEYLDSEASLKDRPEFCKPWEVIEKATPPPSAELANLVQRALKCDKSK